jgi:hypothetical protein
MIYCGPGHQSRIRCEKPAGHGRGKLKQMHKQHRVEHPNTREDLCWTGKSRITCTGFFDESPEEDLE